MLKQSGVRGLEIDLKIVDDIPRVAPSKRPLIINKLLTDSAVGLRRSVTSPPED